jgi:acyl-CoA thioester hydrolase
MNSYDFRLDFQVRDYELDIEGIVNNSVYLNYLEHARHEFLIDKGIDFAKLAQEGVSPIIIKAEIEYKFPLRSRDKFWVGLNFKRESKLKFAFYQDIYLLPDNKPIVKAKITGSVMNEKGRPFLPDVIVAAFGD